MIHPKLAASFSKPDFFFIQVGANDGLADDSLRDLVLHYSWRGILIEPIPYIFEQLLQSYADQRGLTFLCTAVSSHEGAIELWMVPQEMARRGSWDASVLATTRRHLFTHEQCLSKEEAPEYDALLTSIRVPCTTLAAIVKAYKISHIDLLQVDTQGNDFDVIQSLDFSVVKPNFINYERTLLENREFECRCFLEQKGYELFRGLDDSHDSLAVLQAYSD